MNRLQTALICLSILLLTTLAVYSNEVNKGLSREVLQLNAQVKELTTKLKQSVDKVSDLSTQLDKSQKENSTLQIELDKSEQENKKLKQQSIKMKTPSRGGGYMSYVSTFRVKATAYGSSVQNGGVGSGKTFLGTQPVQGRTIAVDPHMVPMGTKVYLECPSYPQINGIHIAEDTGGAIKGNRIDVYFDDIHNNPSVASRVMNDFGVRDVTVYILK